MGCCGSGGCGSGGSAGASPTAGSSCGTVERFEGSDERPILITPNAVAAIKNAIAQEGQPGDGLRVSVVGGGCSGYQYNLDFEREARMGDITLSYDGINVYVDSVSAGYLRGTTIDFVSGLQGTGFKFDNPNAKRTCGCGHSFS